MRNVYVRFINHWKVGLFWIPINWKLDWNNLQESASCSMFISFHLSLKELSWVLLLSFLRTTTLLTFCVNNEENHCLAKKDIFHDRWNNKCDMNRAWLGLTNETRLSFLLSFESLVTSDSDSVRGPEPSETPEPETGRMLVNIKTQNTLNTFVLERSQTFTVTELLNSFL